MKISKAHTILIIAIVLFGGVVFSSVLNPVSAKIATSTNTPTPNIISTLQVVFATQNVQINEQRDRIVELEHQQKRILEDITFEVNKRLWYAYGFATVAVFLAGLFGIRNYNDIEKKAKDKIKSAIDKEFKKQVEEADLTILPIWIKESDILRPVIQRLKLYDLKNLVIFTFYSQNLLKGITIVSIENKEDEDGFQKFIEKYEKELNPQKAAFILYTGKYRVSEKTINTFPNLTLANMPATVGMAVINIGKTLRNLSE